jgi:hypothetical protein
MSQVIVDAQIRCEIEALIYEHAWRLDHHKSDTLAELYMENGCTGIDPCPRD